MDSLCQRNVIGAVNAVSVADIAMAGITSRIPVDEVIDAMGEVGRRHMPVEFRETALGGQPLRPPGEPSPIAYGNRNRRDSNDAGF